MLKKILQRFSVAVAACSLVLSDCSSADAHGFGYYSGFGRPLGIGYSSFGYSGLGYSGLGYGLGYGGLGYSGLGYRSLGWGGWGYPAYRSFNLSINLRRPLLGQRWLSHRPLTARPYHYYRPSYSYTSAYYASSLYSPSYIGSSFYSPSVYGTSYATPTYPYASDCGVSAIYCPPVDCTCCDTTIYPSTSTAYYGSGSYLPSSNYTPNDAWEYEVVPNDGVVPSTLSPAPSAPAAPLLDGDLQIRTTPRYEPAREDWMKLADRAIERMIASGELLDAEIALRQLLAVDAGDRQHHLQAGLLGLLNGRSTEAVAADFAAARDTAGSIPVLSASFRTAVGLQNGQLLEPFIQQASRTALAELDSDTPRLKTYLVSTTGNPSEGAESMHSHTILDTLLRIEDREAEADAIAAAMQR